MGGAEPVDVLGSRNLTPIHSVLVGNEDDLVFPHTKTEPLQSKFLHSAASKAGPLRNYCSL